MKDFADTKEAGIRAGLTADHIRRLVRTGHLRGVKVGRDWLVEITALDEYMAHRPRPGRKPKLRRRRRRPAGNES